jgi:glucose-6-phosphate isomerase
LPYVDGLSGWPTYLQQLEMESLGKQVDNAGAPLNYATCPVVFGTVGTPAQHTFMQAFHQGMESVPTDFILVKKPDHAHKTHHAMLLANGLAQAEALAFGQKDSAGAKAFYGNRPSTILVLERLDARTLGELVALYEHKVFALSIFWDINPFDQWGVELGKKLAKPIESKLGGRAGADVGPSLQMLIDTLTEN